MYIIIRDGNPYSRTEENRYPVLCHNGLAIGSSFFEEECIFDSLEDAKKDLKEISNMYPDFDYFLFEVREVK